MLRETLCEAQALIIQWMPDGHEHHVKRIQALIDEVDRHRPLGQDGKHGDRHTETCGCEDKPAHGEWCHHGTCPGCGTLDVVCLICGHDYSKTTRQPAISVGLTNPEDDGLD